MHAVAKTARALVGRRAFHSPFAVLGNTHQTAPLPPSKPTYSLLEKTLVYSGEPTLNSATGTRTYVVSQPDPADAPYDVPSGAFPTAAPYLQFTATEKPVTLADGYASTSPTPPHPTLTKAVPQNASGVGESAAVRNADAPGELGARGGSHGGLGLMDKSTTAKAPQGSLAERNQATDRPDVAEKTSKLGVDKAWKERR